jgi:hypothetical protein
VSRGSGGGGTSWGGGGGASRGYGGREKAGGVPERRKMEGSGRRSGRRMLDACPASDSGTLFVRNRTLTLIEREDDTRS